MEIDPIYGIVNVTVFKDTGKYYTSEKTPLSYVHSQFHGFQLMQLIKNNHESIRKYSGVVNGFSSEFYYVIDIQYPDHVSNFCTFLLDKTIKTNVRYIGTIHGDLNLK